VQNRQLTPAKRVATLVLVNVAIALVILEVILQVVFAMGWRAEQNQSHLPAILQKIYWTIKPHTSWEEYFVINHANGADLVYGKLHQPHATRGWSMIPDAHTPDYTINHQGYRALYDYTDQPEKYQILIVGDSFTFGDDIDDAHTWPHLLQQRDARLNVWNMGGSGYGTDQMLITLEEEINHYHPDLVIAAFIDDDLNRSMLPFRDYKKPRFLLEQGQLQLTNTPVGDPGQTLQEISRAGYYSHGRIQSLNLFHYLTTNVTLMETEPDPDKTAQLNTAIFDRMQALAHEHHADFLLVYLPNDDELASSEFTSTGETFFEHYIAAHPGANLDPRNDLLKLPFAKSHGHYGANENMLVSEQVLAKIATLDSWKRKQ
jgi:hypothetical protein